MRFTSFGKNLESASLAQIIELINIIKWGCQSYNVSRGLENIFWTVGTELKQDGISSTTRVTMEEFMKNNRFRDRE